MRIRHFIVETSDRWDPVWHVLAKSADAAVTAVEAEIQKAKSPRPDVVLVRYPRVDRLLVDLDIAAQF